MIATGDDAGRWLRSAVAYAIERRNGHAVRSESSYTVAVLGDRLSGSGGDSVDAPAVIPPAATSDVVDVAPRAVRMTARPLHQLAPELPVGRPGNLRCRRCGAEVTLAAWLQDEPCPGTVA